MTQPQVIIDYAAPKAHGKARLQSRSVLDFQANNQASTVIERLSGERGAWAAASLAGFGLACMLLAIFAQWHWLRLIERPIALSVWAALMAGAAAIVNNTWRKTILIADRDQLVLIFESPLRHRQVHTWPVSEIDDVRMDKPGGSNVNELWILPRTDLTVRLFSGHDYPSLHRAMTSIKAAMAGEEPQSARPVSTVRHNSFLNYLRHGTDQ